MLQNIQTLIYNNGELEKELEENSVFTKNQNIKYLGKKWFAFSKMDIESIGILNRLDVK